MKNNPLKKLEVEMKRITITVQEEMATTIWMKIREAKISTGILYSV
jgi:hypothetical protein